MLVSLRFILALLDVHTRIIQVLSMLQCDTKEALDVLDIFYPIQRQLITADDLGP